MVIKYEKNWEVQSLINQIVETLNLKHVREGRVVGVRSTGSKSRRILARCWAMSKIFQTAFGQPPAYVIEVIGRRWDKLSTENKEKLVIHELLHIPKCFGGGLRPHKGCVTSLAVNKIHEEYQKRKNYF
ncbi:MAG: metallopeptidase [Nanoarchaeota archaeon]|nr:metallopeptidase [Nanoarchaeota archaeon]